MVRPGHLWWYTESDKRKTLATCANDGVFGADGRYVRLGGEMFLVRGEDRVLDPKRLAIEEEKVLVPCTAGEANAVRPDDLVVYVETDSLRYGVFRSSLPSDELPHRGSRVTITDDMDVHGACDDRRLRLQQGEEVGGLVASYAERVTLLEMFEDWSNDSWKLKPRFADFAQPPLAASKRKETFEDCCRRILSDVEGSEVDLEDLLVGVPAEDSVERFFVDDWVLEDVQHLKDVITALLSSERSSDGGAPRVAKDQKCKWGDAMKQLQYAYERISANEGYKQQLVAMSDVEDAQKVTLEQTFDDEIVSGHEKVVSFKRSMRALDPALMRHKVRARVQEFMKRKL